MIEPMLAACPSFRPAWEAYCAEWEGQSVEPPLYPALGDLARHLLEQLCSGSDTEFPEAFRVVGRWHCEGDQFVREAATIGLLESIQNNASHAGVDPAVFERWLLPESKKWWDKLIQFWSGDVRALHPE